MKAFFIIIVTSKQQLGYTDTPEWLAVTSVSNFKVWYALDVSFVETVDTSLNLGV